MLGATKRQSPPACDVSVDVLVELLQYGKRIANLLEQVLYTRSLIQMYQRYALSCQRYFQVFVISKLLWTTCKTVSKPCLNSARSEVQFQIERKGLPTLICAKEDWAELG